MSRDYDKDILYFMPLVLISSGKFHEMKVSWWTPGCHDHVNPGPMSGPTTKSRANRKKTYFKAKRSAPRFWTKSVVNEFFPFSISWWNCKEIQRKGREGWMGPRGPFFRPQFVFFSRKESFKYLGLLVALCIGQSLNYKIVDIHRSPFDTLFPKLI